MTTKSADSTDMGVGYGVLFVFLALAGAAMMLIAPGDTVGAAGFGIAVLFACLVVVATHLHS